MPITIDAVRGIGGSPPTHIRVSGTKTGCESVVVWLTCREKKSNPYPPFASGSGDGPWSYDVPYSGECGCGDQITVEADCNVGQGLPSPQAIFVPFTIDCDECPSVNVSATLGPCVNGVVLVTLNATVTSLPPGGPTIFQWEHHPGQVGFTRQATATGAWPPMPIPLVNQFSYTSGTYTANLLTVFPAGCTALPVTFTVDCPPACCPSLTIDRPQTVNNQTQPEVTGCAPTSAVATFSAQLSWTSGCTPATPTSFNWTLNGPTGRKYQKSTNAPNTDTTTGWRDDAGNAAVVQFTTGGVYSIAVMAIVPGVPPSCNPTDPAQFFVPSCCPALIGPLNASSKMGDPCTWIFSAGVSNPTNATVTFEWSFQDGTVATTLLPQTDHTYLPNAPMTGMTTVMLKSPNCADQSLQVPVTQTCQCPAIGTPGAVVTGCVPGPGTAPGTPPAVVLSTSVSPPVATSFDWTITTPGGISFTKTTAAASTTDGTADGAWTETSTGSTGVLNLGASGGYAVTVRAQGPSISPTCLQPSAMSFSVPICPCPPGMARDASGVCVPTPTPTPTPSCTIWCILAGIFLIAIPISAYISTAAHCILGPTWSITLQGGIIAMVIGIFIGLCGTCCLWIFLLIGSTLGVVATLIAAIWLGFPACWLVALPILSGFIGLGVGIAFSCGWRIR